MDSLKQATVRRLLKKLDASDFNNFQPISTLNTKVLEKTVFIQLQSFLSSNQIFLTFQSALLRVFNDILSATDSGDSVI